MNYATTPDRTSLHGIHVKGVTHYLKYTQLASIPVRPIHHLIAWAFIAVVFSLPLYDIVSQLLKP